MSTTGRSLLEEVVEDEFTEVPKIVSILPHNHPTTPVPCALDLMGILL